MSVYKVEKEMKTLGLNPKSVQIQWLYEKAKLFHITASKFLIKYFKKPLKDISMDNMIERQYSILAIAV